MAVRWSTKEDVQADLARVTGQRIPLVDEGCLVYGERPPPRFSPDEETEEEHQLRSGASIVKSQQVPDLRGITNMLRMVQNYGNDNSSLNLITSTDEMVVIRKPTPNQKLDRVKEAQSTDPGSSSSLNPNVKEFVPKFLTGGNKCKTGDSRIDPAERSAGPETDDDPNSGANRGLEPLTARQRRERHELGLMLQSKIHTPTDDCPRRRRERYTAIAGLLRLHSAPAPASASAPALLTPDYFRTHRAEPAPDEREVRASVSKVRAWLEDTAASLAPASPPGYAENVAASLAPAPGNLQDPAASLAPAPASLKDPLASVAPAPASLKDPLASVAPAPASLKDPLASVAPAPASLKDPLASVAAPGDARYVPSAGARALSAQYAARAAAAPAPPLSLWERLERDLRRKDEQRRSPL